MLLGPEQLHQNCDLEQYGFETTAELTTEQQLLGQNRAVDAFKYSLNVKDGGHHLFAMGLSAGSRVNIALNLVTELGSNRPTAPDWCYVYNFSQPNSPNALSLEAGMGCLFKHDVAQLVEDLTTMIPAAFESEEYQGRRQAIEHRLQERQEEALNVLGKKSRELNVELISTPSGFAFAPIKEGQAILPDAFQALPEAEQKQIESTIKQLQKELQETLRQFPSWQKETLQEIRTLNHEVTSSVVDSLIGELLIKYEDHEEIYEYLSDFKNDVVEHSASFLHRPESENPLVAAPDFSRYQVNVLVAQPSDRSIPVIYEDNPSLPNLVGRIEHEAQFGTLTTNHTLIKSGALHRAVGGFLILEVEKLLTKLMAWEGLKRSLSSGLIHFDSIERSYGWATTIGLDPEPIPLDTKVILVGDRRYFYLLSEYDPEFSSLFKVVADFDEIVPRSVENNLKFPNLIAKIVAEEQLLPFNRRAVARLNEFSARMAEDAERLSVNRDKIRDLMIEANYIAQQNNQSVVEDSNINDARRSAMFRHDRIRERVQEQILRETLLIDTSGEKIGQINGLAVYSLGQMMFGKPSRISARVRLGNGNVLDIERKAELGGPTHTKGVMILSSFLASRYAAEAPLSLSASLVFEQSYGGVDGDSASSTELYALMSALSGLPIRQSFAVTGSVNQFGDVQAIGGVNEKIEGFFDICQTRGLTGDQGVIIPLANVKNLMLREDLVQAVRDEQFHIHAVQHIDEGIEILTGIPAGEEIGDNAFPEGSVNALIMEKLKRLQEKKKSMQKNGTDNSNQESE